MTSQTRDMHTAHTYGLMQFDILKVKYTDRYCYYRNDIALVSVTILKRVRGHNVPSSAQLMGVTGTLSLRVVSPYVLAGEGSYMFACLPVLLIRFWFVDGVFLRPLSDFPGVVGVGTIVTR